MTEAEKADALLRLMDIHSARFRQSRDLEFKVNIVIWAILAIFGKFLSDARVKVDDWATLIIYLFIYFHSDSDLPLPILVKTYSSIRRS